MTSFLRRSWLIAALLPGPAIADSKQADEHVAKAMKAHEAGKFEEALAELTAAYKLDPRPELAYAIGQVDVKLGKCGEARASYEKFLDASKDAQARSLVQQALDACVPAAEPPPKKRVDDPPPKKVDAPPSKKVDDPGPAVTRTVRKPFYKDVVGDTLVVAGVASAVVGLVFYQGARSDQDAGDASGSLTKFKELNDSAGKKQTTSIVFAAGGAALVVAGIVSYVKRDRTEVRRVAVTVGPDGGLVAWTGRF